MVSAEIEVKKVFKVVVEIGEEEVRWLAQWMGEHSGPEAPVVYKEILGKLRELLRKG